MHDLLAAGVNAAAASGSAGVAGQTISPSTGSGGPTPASASASSTPSAKRKDEDRVPKRGYRACVHCRLRKAKCDLGDVNAPSEPPCTRCRREQRNCVFLPSKRRRKTAGDDIKPEIYPASSLTGNSSHGGFQSPLPAFAGLAPLPGPGPAQSASSGTMGMGQRPHMGHADGSDGLHVRGRQGAGLSVGGGGAGGGADDPARMGGGPSMGSGPGGASAHGTGGGWSEPLALFEQPKLSPLFDPPSAKTSSSLASGSTPSPSAILGGMGSRRRKRHDGPDATRRIIVASFNNETDALEILAKAATDGDGDGEPADKNEERVHPSKRVAWADAETPRAIGDFLLLKRGILDERRLELLVQVFFTHHHPVLPICQTVRIPHSKAQLAAMAHDDPFLLCAIVCVASHHHPDPGMKDVHEKTYALIREILADYQCAGFQPSIGFVEGVLILAENLPRERLSATAAEMAGPASDVQGLHGLENRRSWALTGTAIRAAYGLGLDQLALEDGERDPDLERARGVWTWCYLYDRTLGLRTGLAFWSRGPTICFQGLSDISQTGEAAARVNFPYMMTTASGDTPTSTSSASALLDTNDSACMMQAYMELTQIMTNAHDILFSTPSRTATLVRKGEYFKFLDHFRRALESFCYAWKDKVWRLDSVRELTWCTYHFVRLYVAAFAFQAHVQRAQERAEHEREQGRSGVISIFPRGSATSPDAVYIYESIDAAHEILGICLRLGHAGILRYLPSRYLINFAYSGTFALKAAYSGAVAKTDIGKTTELVERVCAALLLASPDKDHPACRYGQMLRMLTRRLAELNDQSAVPSRFPSPEPNAAPDTNMPMHIHHFGDVPSGHSGDHLAPPEPMAMPVHDDHQNQTLFDLDQVPANLFDVDLDVGFNLDGFWEDFTLTDSGGFPFK